MKIMGLGLDFSGKQIFNPMDDDDVIQALVEAMEHNADRVQNLARTTEKGVSYRGERQRVTVDPGDPKVAGWTFLMNAADPQREEITALLQPLAKHRGMIDPAKPLLYFGESLDEWFDWLHDNYFSLNLRGEKVPQYILVVGGPDQVPFLFQSVLNTVANVGRVSFNTLDDLQNYISKVIRLETMTEPVVTEEAIFFAPDAGLPDPTYFSRQYMVEPLAEHIREEQGFETHILLGDDATKANLLGLLTTKKPALVYTASHGLGALTESLEVQKRYNGAICCQHNGSLSLDSLLAADDVPFDQPFLEGAVFFQFACFGYGTPAQSDYAHWLKGVPTQYAEADFVAALPTKLLAHPQGPIAFIGHLDTAFLHGFADVEAPHILDRWHGRIAPFKKATDRLLTVQPSGLAMQDMCMRYSVCNALITNTYDQHRRGRLIWNTRLKARFLDNWIIRGDAQNYMILGDPAVHLRIPTE